MCSERGGIHGSGHQQRFIRSDDGVWADYCFYRTILEKEQAATGDWVENALVLTTGGDLICRYE